MTPQPPLLGAEGHILCGEGWGSHPLVVSGLQQCFLVSSYWEEQRLHGPGICFPLSLCHQRVAGPLPVQGQGHIS